MKESAGLLMYRRRPSGVQVFLVHPGGPLWANKDRGVWSIPKGELDSGEDPLTAACREFHEETGFSVEQTDAVPLGSVRQKAGKTVHAWAIEGVLDPSAIQSNTFEMEWPPRSGRVAAFPEVDRGQWFDLEAAIVKVNPAQVALIDRLRQLTS